MGKVSCHSVKTSLKQLSTIFLQKEEWIPWMRQFDTIHSTKRIARRWPLTVFSNMIHISAMKAIGIWMQFKTTFQCKKGVSRALLISLAKTLGGISAEYNTPVQRPVSCHLCLASENQNMRRKSKMTVHRANLVNKKSKFVISAGNRLYLYCVHTFSKK